jgi:prepilin-type processing-associated H-X9-DG protein
MRNNVRGSYFFATGVFTDYNAPWHIYAADIRRGAFGNNGAAKFADIRDGTSNSIAAGEGSGGGGNRTKTSWVYGPWQLGGTHTCCHGRVVTGSSSRIAHPNNLLIYRNDWHINSVWRGNARQSTYAWVFNSQHPGGAQFAMCDGSVTFLPEMMDYEAFCRLNYIADGEPVEIP